MTSRSITDVPSAHIAEALRKCRDIARLRARNFYYGLKLSPEPQRSALFVIYAWMRAADDLVDAANGHATEAVQLQIDAFRAATDGALDGRLGVGGDEGDGRDALWIAMADIARRFPLQADPFHAMLDGQLDDLAHGQYETFDQLRNYCYRVASTVGLICIEIWGYDDDSARELAVERGIGFQLTNIIRDYKQDFDSGRIYLPKEDFERHGIDPQTLRAWSKPAACQAMMMQEIQRARSYYERSTELDALISPACRPTLWAMTSIYRGLLEKMSHNPSRLILSKRLRLSAMRKGAIAIRAKWQARAARNTAGLGAPAVSHVSGNPTA